MTQASQPKTCPVTLPLMGEGVQEATVVKWLRKEGDLVTKGEPLLEVSTDKVDTELTSPESGFLIAIFSKPGTVTKVGAPLGELGSQPDLTPQFQHAAVSVPPTSSQPHPRFSPSPRSPSASPQIVALRPETHRAGPRRISPLAKRLASEAGLSWENIPGSGPLGRVVASDVAQAVSQWALPQASSGGTLFLTDERFRQKTTFSEDGTERLDGVVVKRVKMSPIRRLTAEHMIRSVSVSPHVTTTFEMDLGRVRDARDRFLKENPQDRLTFTSFFLFAAAQALKAYPMLNASVDGEDILFREQIRLGCAVALEQGLIVVVIPQADTLDLFGFARALQDLTARARFKKLTPEDVQGGTFTLTNPGMFGSLHSQPILNQPQVGILSVGAIVQRPAAVEDRVEIRPLCQVGLTFDHRIVDGEGGARFLAHIKNTLENVPLL